MNRNTPEELGRSSTPFGDALRELRTMRGWTPAVLAEKTHFSRGHVVNVENGTRRPSIQLAKACDEVFGTGTRLVQLVPSPEPRVVRTVLRPMQLPRVPRVFIGRSGLIDELNQHLGTHGDGVVVLHGPAGVGKTWSARHWADRARAWYPDGIFYFDLHGHVASAAHASPAAVLRDALSALGIPEDLIPGSLDARSALWRSALDGRRVLIIADNAATVAQVRPLLPGSAAGDVLITSRSEFGDLAVSDGAYLIAVPEFTAAESIELLRAIIGSDRVDRDLDAAHAIADQAGYLPANVRSAAQQATDHADLTLTDLVRRLAYRHAHNSGASLLAPPESDDQHRPREDDVDKPSVSRVYNSILGEAQNFAADREFAAQLRELLPDASELVLLNRGFLARAIRYCIAQGIDQVIDIGAGLPTGSSTHQIARAVDPNCRVLYVDNEIVTAERLRESVTDQAGLASILWDFRELPAAYHRLDELARDAFGDPVIDPTRPVALLMGLMLHFIPDEDHPAETLAEYRRMIAPGSYVAASHDTADGREEQMRELARLYVETNRPLILRDRTELARLFRGYDWIEPGITRMNLWHPDAETPRQPHPESTGAYVCVVRTPTPASRANTT